MPSTKGLFKGFSNSLRSKGSASSKENDMPLPTEETTLVPVKDETDGETAFRRKAYDTISERALEMSRILQKTRGSSFFDDAINMRSGTVPHSILVALVCGVVCGVAAFCYYICLWNLLEFFWKYLPEKYVEANWSESHYVLWIPLVGFTMAILAGATVVFMGEPGDLAYTIKMVHTNAYIPMNHVMPMVVASQFGILGGGSLGPEAPLVAICAALAGYVSRAWFKEQERNIIRKHTLMGMAGALAAFFGCPLGGSLFALEVNSRFGVEYFEHAVEAIFCGEVTLSVFRLCAGLPIGPIWTISSPAQGPSSPSLILVGGAIGMLGAATAAIFAQFHFKVMGTFKKFGLLEDKKAIFRAIVGACVIVPIGMFIPQTMFWGEYEFQAISTMSPAADLDHVWPTSGLLNFEMTSAFKCFLVGLFKLIAISFTVAGGYRGGFIFPFFACGAAFGRALTHIFPWIPAPYATLCYAAGINVAITRTSLATTLILCYLAQEQNCISAVLLASLVSLFATGYMPFIKSQVIRSDIEEALYFRTDKYSERSADSTLNESEDGAHH